MYKIWSFNPAIIHVCVKQGFKAGFGDDVMLLE